MPAWDVARSDPSTYPLGLDLPVLYGDLDPNRHVNNVAMGRFFEHARVVAHTDLGLFAGVRPQGRIVVARVALDYVAEAFLGDLRVGTRITAVGRSSLTEQQAAWQDGRLVALAEVVVVHLLADRPAAWPDPVLGLLQPQLTA